MFTIQYREEGGRAVAMSVLQPPSPKPITLPWQCGFSGGGKEEEYAKTHTKGRVGELREDRAYDRGCNSRSPLSDAVGSLRKELIRLWNSILPELGQPSAQLSKLIRLTACKKTKHALSRWYRTVYIPRLVTSYDTHKGKRWLNSNPQATGVNDVIAPFFENKWASILFLKQLPLFSCCEQFDSCGAIHRR